MTVTTRTVIVAEWIPNQLVRVKSRRMGRADKSIYVLIYNCCMMRKSAWILQQRSIALARQYIITLDFVELCSTIRHINLCGSRDGIVIPVRVKVVVVGSQVAVEAMP